MLDLTSPHTVRDLARLAPFAILALPLALGCASTRDEDPFGTGGLSDGGTTGITTGGTTSSGASDSGGASGASDGTTGPGSGSDSDSDSDSDGGIKFDTPDGNTGAGDDGPQMGCEKVDFLFVIDNSGSMSDEQQNLVSSFPGFISTIEQTLMAKNFHILVTDTDAASLSFGGLSCVNGVCGCNPMPQCCVGMCHGGNIAPQPTECGGKACSEWELPSGCDATLGAGKVVDPGGNDCGITSGQRYMLDSQPDLTGTFQCVAKVGAGGDGNEKPMEAMMEAVGPLNPAGQCNEAFLRDDAILVVTFITDEEDDGKSMGDPAAWKQFLVDAKNGNEEAVVMLGLVGDPDLPNPVCGGGDADASPVLRSFAESFTHGQWGSICSADYTPFFVDAVSVIDAACDDFVPPG